MLVVFVQTKFDVFRIQGHTTIIHLKLFGKVLADMDEPELDELRRGFQDSPRLEKLFDVLKVRYHTTPEDYATFPPMAQDKDDGTYGKH